METALASKVKLITGGTSYHYDSTHHEYLNEVHPSIGIAYNGYQVVYTSKNSWEEASLYVTYYHDFIITDRLVISPHIGFATGYYKGVSLWDSDSGYTIHGSEHYNSAGIIPVIGVAATFYPSLEYDLGFMITTTPYAAMFNVVWGR